MGPPNKCDPYRGVVDIWRWSVREFLLYICSVESAYTQSVVIVVVDRGSNYVKCGTSLNTTVT